MASKKQPHPERDPPPAIQPGPLGPGGPSTPALPPLREVIARHGIAAQKSLGQNFILDLNLTRRIARAAGRLDGATIVEIGPGPGGLTRALLAEGARKATLDVRVVFDTLHEIAAAAGTGSQGRKLDLLSGLLGRATPLEARYLLRSASSPARASPPMAGSR